MSNAPKRVLLVDDERAFLRGISSYLRTHEGFDVYTAVNGVQALELLGTQPIDVVVTDLQMPVMDGFALLTRLRDAYPALPVIVMTAYATPETLARMEELGSIPCLEKPLLIEDLVDELQVVLEERARGYLRGISVASLLQLLEMERKTVTLEIMHGASTGTLSFREGRLIDAATGDLRGDAAAMEIIGWDAATVRLDAGGPPPRKTVMSGLHFLMMESMRMLDEGRPVQDAVLTAPAAGPAEPLPMPRKLTPAQRAALDADMKRVVQVDGVTGVALLTSDGLVLTSHALADLEDFEDAASGFAAIAAEAHAVAEKTHLGGCGEITLGTRERLVLVRSPEIHGKHPLRFVLFVEWGCDQVAIGRLLGEVIPSVTKKLASND